MLEDGESKDPTNASVEKEHGENSSVPEEFLVNGLPRYAHERRIVLKFDLRVLPVLAVMYLFNSLDKGNLGNAKTDNLEADLHFTGNQYNILLSVFFVPYVLCAPPIALLGKKFGPHRTLSLLMISFGSMTLLSTAATNWGGLMAIRWILGMSESAFFPLVIYYLTTFYRRGELARRLAIFYAAFGIANAFSGLLAFGVFQIQDSRLYGWRYLFLIEGAATVLFAVFAYFYLPRSGPETRFLTEEERHIAYQRVQEDSSAIVNEPFVLREAMAIFKMPVAYAWLAIAVCLGVPLQSVALFLPQIVARLGFDTVKTNLYTVAPNITGSIVLLILAYTSDYARIRFPFLALGFLLTFSGFAIALSPASAANEHLAYFACFMMTWGTAAPSVLLATWLQNNTAHEGRRMAIVAIAIPLANMMGVVSSNIFLNQDAPKYIPALATTAAFGGLGAVLTLILGLFMIIDNARRDRRQGFRIKANAVSTRNLREGPNSPDFRWFL